MSKIAHYLNEHLLGEVTGLTSLRQRYSTDGSVFAVTPELVAFPRTTSDMRKIARFAWQLTEKGHPLHLTARGLGGDTTGAAIGDGVVIDTTKYLNNILYVEAQGKRKFAHVQPGVSLSGLQQALKWHGLSIGGYKDVIGDMTVGGAIASGFAGPASGKYGTVAGAVERMEVVLSNGDVIETARISKRDLNRKKGEQTLEGELYRRIDGIIEDNQDLVASLATKSDLIGYQLGQVRQRDGSFDLTPLFMGSQGTLGIISEVVLKTNFYSGHETILVAVCESAEQARDAAQALVQSEPASLLVIDHEYYETARGLGKRFIFDHDKKLASGVVLYVSFDDFSDAARKRKLKKAAKTVEKFGISAIYSSEETPADTLHALRDVEQIVSLPSRVDQMVASICDGAYVPRERYEEFVAQVATLADKTHTKLPLKVDMMTGIVTILPPLHLGRVADKQKVFKLSVEFAAIVAGLGGSVAGRVGEGRLGAYAAYPQEDETLLDLYDQVRKAFDPYGILNPGVKQRGELRSLARQLRAE